LLQPILVISTSVVLILTVMLMCESQVHGVQLLNELTVSIGLHSTAVALFVWLNADGFSGRFSDNGFLMVKPDISVMFHSWTKISSREQFENSLTVHSLADMYTSRQDVPFSDQL